MYISTHQERTFLVYELYIATIATVWIFLFVLYYFLFLISYFCFIKGVRRDLLRDHLCHDGHRQHCLQPHRGHLPHSRCTRKQSRRQLTNANGRNYQDISNANTFSRPLSLEWDRIVFLNGVSDHVDGPVLPETHPQRPDQRIKVIKTPPMDIHFKRKL